MWQCLWFKVTSTVLRNKRNVQQLTFSIRIDTELLLHIALYCPYLTHLSSTISNDIDDNHIEYMIQRSPLLTHLHLGRHLMYTDNLLLAIADYSTRLQKLFIIFAFDAGIRELLQVSTQPTDL